MKAPEGAEALKVRFIDPVNVHTRGEWTPWCLVEDDEWEHWLRMEAQATGVELRWLFPRP